MFEFSLALLDGIRNEGMVQLFTVLIKNIAVSLDWRDSRNLVNIGENLNQ
jgi:hypothetical protein